jgi:hypothetical protein
MRINKKTIVFELKLAPPVVKRVFPANPVSIG